MHGHILKLAAIALVVLPASFIARLALESRSPSRDVAAITSVGNVETVVAAYDKWKTAMEKNGSDRKLTLALHYSKGLSSAFTKAQGQASLDLIDGSLTVNVSGLPKEDTYEVWLIDNRVGESVAPEGTDTMVHVGTLARQKGKETLQEQLEQEAFIGFELDLVVVTPTGKPPSAARILVGSPSLFQRLYYNEERGLLAKVADADVSVGPEASGKSLWSSPFRALVPAPAYAQETESLNATLGSLVARGEDLFFNETFKGNGRTCGTCHPAENNLTIDPVFIATLPPKDPLFVAEFIPALNFEKNGGKRFEDPELMRNFGLIVENQDGFDDLANKFNMRGVPHTLALPTSLTINPPPAPDAFPQQATGWSGDGAPGSGSLRDFATGAVTQHFPLTTNRVPAGPGVRNPDFRLPRPRELDALEAFQLSLGRQEELALPLPLNNAVALRGQEIFLDNNVGKCNRCHGNAGANTAGSLRDGAPNTANFDTGVERLPDQPARVFKAAKRPPEFFPCDGGFGTEQTKECGFGSNNPAFGNNQFNTPTLVEAADTPPFFHNNAINTIEGAVAFYNSQAFNDTGRVGGISLEPTQVEAVAAFLRVINGLENIRSSIALDDRALRSIRTTPKANAKNLLIQSREEVKDAIDVLKEVGLHLDAVRHLNKAKHLVNKAINNSDPYVQMELIREAIREQNLARRMMVARG